MVTAGMAGKDDDDDDDDDNDNRETKYLGCMWKRLLSRMLHQAHSQETEKCCYNLIILVDLQVHPFLYRHFLNDKSFYFLQTAGNSFLHSLNLLLNVEKVVKLITITISDPYSAVL
jgi:hypothetical protein